MSDAPPRRILPVIVFSQFAGTSLWFAGNAIAGDLQAHFALAQDAVGTLTSSVQLGFIAGTLLSAFLSLSDRFSPRAMFLASALLGAFSNLCILFFAQGYYSLVLCRFATGVCLAGIYPVGMKVAASWYQRGLGRAIGFLVGALVLGTAFPYLLRGVGGGLAWETVVIAVSALAAVGGLALYALVPDGPQLPPGTPFDPRALAVVFRSRDFRAARHRPAAGVRRRKHSGRG
jgi:MFS family permease